MWALRALGKVDRDVYRVVAELPTPWLDGPLRRVSDFANFSKPWFLVAGALALFGGRQGAPRRRGRRGRDRGDLARGQPADEAGGDRGRPQRAQLGVPETRWVRMPTSASFPSGHSASAAAFCVAVGAVVPELRWPLRVAAAVVAFSRVYTGVHYPGDVLVGAAVGAALGRLTSRVAVRLHTR